MENRKHVELLIPIVRFCSLQAFILGFFILSTNNAFAYEIETHAFLTNEIIKFYNQNFSNNQISTDLTPYLLDGSRREDDAPRWMNHFYDPVYNRGLSYDPKIDPLYTLMGTWQKSKDWAQDSNSQNNLTYKVPATIASILNAIQEQKITAISTETDFTWQEAIKFYSQGDKEKVMFILGHILHLIEDISVPDHTRNDPHPGDSPYENYTQKFTLANPDKNLAAKLVSKNPIVLSDLNSYFNGLAIYSNNNFYSKDTIGIQNGYQLPQPDYVQKDGDYFYGFKTDEENGDYKIFIKENQGLFRTVVSSTGVVSLLLNKSGGDKVLSDYWSRLSTKSVEYGAGVINLFFQEAEAAKNNTDLAKTEQKSFFSQAVDTVKNLAAQVGDFFSGVFNNDQNFQPVAQVSLEQNEIQSSNTDSQNNQQPSQSQTTNQSQAKAKLKNQLPKQTEQQINQDQAQQPVDEDQNLLDNPQQLDQQVQDQQTQLTHQVQLTQTTFTSKQCSFNATKSPSHQGIVINEVAWMGAVSDANNEWIVPQRYIYHLYLG